MWFNAKIKLFIEIHWWLPRVEKLSNLVNEIPFSFWYIYVIHYIENIVVVIIIVITLKKKNCLFIKELVEILFLAAVIFLFYTYGFFFQMQSLMWNLVSLALFGTWSWNAFWKIYSLCLSKHEFWWRVLNCFGCLWYRCLFIYICNNNCIIQILLFIIEWFDCRNIFVTWYINY